MTSQSKPTGVALNDADDVPGAKYSKDPAQCVVEEFKRWLKCHGLKKCGKKMN